MTQKHYYTPSKFGIDYWPYHNSKEGLSCYEDMNKQLQILHHHFSCLCVNFWVPGIFFIWNKNILKEKHLWKRKTWLCYYACCFIWKLNEWLWLIHLIKLYELLIRIPTDIIPYLRLSWTMIYYNITKCNVFYVSLFRIFGRFSFINLWWCV